MTIKIVFTGSNWAEIEAQLRSYHTPSAAESPTGAGEDAPLPSPEPAALGPTPEPKAKKGRPK